MSDRVRRIRTTAGWLVRLEIVILSLIYIYFVVTDRVPPVAWVTIAAIWIARWWTRGALSRTTPLDVPIALILLGLPFALWASTDWWLSVPKVYGVLLGATFYYAVVNGVRSRRDLAWAAIWLTITTLGIGLAGIVGTDWAQDKIVSISFVYERLPRVIQGIPRSIAGGFSRNGVGGTLTLIVPFLASLALTGRDVLALPLPGDPTVQRDGRRPAAAIWIEARAVEWFRIVVAAALVIAIVALGLTQSRGGLLGTAVGLAALAIWWNRRFAWGLVAGGAGLAAMLAAGKGQALVDLVLRMDAKSGTLASRLEVWQRGVLMTQDFPWTGIGIGTYNTIAHALYPFFIAGPDEVVAHAHNNLLEVAVDFGIPGLIAFVAFLTGYAVCVARAYRDSEDRGVRALLAGVGFGMLANQVFGLTDAFILGTKPGVLIWVYAALAAVAFREVCFPCGSTTWTSVVARPANAAARADNASTTG